MLEEELSGSSEERRIANVWMVELSCCVLRGWRRKGRNRRQWILYDLLDDRAVGTYLPKRNLDEMWMTHCA
jgi:hypothetical protein